MRFIFEQEEDDEVEELKFTKALHLWVRGKITRDKFFLSDENLTQIKENNNIKGQSKLYFSFEDEDDFLKMLELSEDDISFYNQVNSSYSSFEFNDPYSSEQDFLEGYGPVTALNEENLRKFKKIVLSVTGVEYDSHNPSYDALKIILKTFPYEIDRLINDFHYRKNDEMEITARQSINDEVKEFSEKLGLKFTKPFNEFYMTPADIIMSVHKYRMGDVSFKEFFEKLIEKTPGVSRLGGWWDNMYEFQDWDNFDDAGYNRDAGQQLDKIIESFEDNPEYNEFFGVMSEILSKFKVSKKYEVPANKNYDFEIDGFDLESGKIKLTLYKKKGSYSRKKIKISNQGFYNLLYQPTLFKLDTLFED